MFNLNELVENIQKITTSPSNYRKDLALICLIRNALSLRNIEISRIEFSILLNYSVQPARFQVDKLNLQKYRALYYNLLNSHEIEKDLLWHYNDELNTYKTKLSPSEFWKSYSDSDDVNTQILNEYRTFLITHKLLQIGYPIPTGILTDFTNDELVTSISKGCQTYTSLEDTSGRLNLLAKERERREQSRRTREL